jgi:hypothetical protein
MLYLYAQIDRNNICAGISQLSGVIEQSDMIPLTEEEYTDDLIGRLYENGTWGDKVIIDPVDPPSVEQLKPLWEAVNGLTETVLEQTDIIKAQNGMIAEQESALRIIMEVEKVEQS